MKPEILIWSSEEGAANPSLLFVHGAFAGAWCWEPNFVPFFRSQGFDCASLSFRGHGNSPGRRWLWSFGIDDYVEDLKAVLDQLPRPPVLVAHSMGGFVSQKMLQQHTVEVAGLVLMSPAAPTGHLTAAAQMLSQHPLLCWKLQMVNASPKMLWPWFLTLQDLRRVLLSSATSLESVEEFVPHLQHESARAMVEMLWPLDAPSPGYEFPILLLGGDQDIIIPPEIIQRVGECLGTEPKIFSEMGHSMMLEDGWRAPAEAILEWLPRGDPVSQDRESIELY